MEQKIHNSNQEKATEIAICIVDESYGTDCHINIDEQLASLHFQKVISDEFSVKFEEVDIGPGASLPAFITFISEHYVTSILGGALVVFLSGKAVTDNFIAWKKMAKEVKRFFTRHAYLNRNGAAIIAIEATIAHIGALPSTIKLLGYNVSPYHDSDLLVNMQMLNEISEPVETPYLGATIHIFDIQLDEIILRVFVDGKKVKITKFETPTKH